VDCDDLRTARAGTHPARHPHVFGTVKEDEKKDQYPLSPLLEARKFAERLKDPFIIESAHDPTEEAEEGSRFLKMIADVWRKGINPEIALRKALVCFCEQNPEENG
jgi:hypothetical protein